MLQPFERIRWLKVVVKSKCCFLLKGAAKVHVNIGKSSEKMAFQNKISIFNNVSLAAPSIGDGREQINYIFRLAFGLAVGNKQKREMEEQM